MLWGRKLSHYRPRKVNLWYFCVERNAGKDDDDDDEEDYEDGEEEASSSESEQEENKVRSRRLAARR